MIPDDDGMIEKFIYNLFTEQSIFFKCQYRQAKILAWIYICFDLNLR